jgi:hypothetical protein
MDSKTEDPKLYKNHLLALVALLGIDEAIAMLQRERVHVVAIIDGNREQFRALSGLPAKALPAKALPAKALPAKMPTKARMIGVLKNELRSGPRPIHLLLLDLKRQGLIPDTETESRREVEKILRDKTFATRSTGVYALRIRG